MDSEDAVPYTPPAQTTATMQQQSATRYPRSTGYGSWGMSECGMIVCLVIVILIVWCLFRCMRSGSGTWNEGMTSTTHNRDVRFDSDYQRYAEFMTPTQGASLGKTRFVGPEDLQRYLYTSS